MSSSAIEDLHDDGFEGSHHEQYIFSEVFFGKDISGKTKRSLVADIINFKCENSKIRDMSLCSNSENSAVTSQSSPISLLVEDSGLNENSGGASASGCFPERSSLVESDDQNESVKRMKFSVDEPFNPDTNTLKALISSMPPKEIVAAMDAVDVDFVNQTVTLHLVESSCQGFTSSCCLLKQHGKVDRGGDRRGSDFLKCGLPNSDGHNGKEVALVKAVASPVSQESFATKILVASPCADILGNSGSPLHAEERPKVFDSPGLDASNMLKTDSTKDPRPFLQSHVSRILLAMGWCIERRKRPSRKYMESVYRSPEGRLFREFPKVWKLCGQILFADRYNLVQEDNGKEWTDISQFWSDLLDALMNVEKKKDESDIAGALAHQWSLLDPFVKVVFIDRKVGSLRKGYMVKATQSLVIDRNQKNYGIMALKNVDGVENQSAQKNLLAWPCDSSLATKSVSTICEGSYHAYDEQSGDKSFSEYDGQSNDVVNCQTGVSVYMTDKEGVSLVDIANGMGNQSCRMHNDKVSSLDMPSLLTCGSDGTCVQLCSCQCNVPVTAGNDNVHGEAESDSPHQDSNLVDLDDGNGHLDFNLATSTQFVTLGVLQQSGLGEEEGGQCIQTSRFKMKDKGDVVLKKKTRRKSKKISEIRSTMLYQSDNIDVHGNEAQKLNKVEENVVVNSRTKKSCKKSSPISSFLHQVEKNGSKLKKMHCSSDGSKYGQKKPTSCKIKDDDLLVSAIIRNKGFSPGATRTISKKKAHRLRARTKLKCQKGSCRLLPRNLGKAGKHYLDGKWTAMGSRTVLLWLINAGVISLNDVIQYRNTKDDVMIKDGLITSNGIVCKCCNMMFSISKFKSHAGFNLSRSRPCLNLFMESGKPFTLCQLQAWSAEYKTRKRRNPVVRSDEDDQNDDSCGLCGDGGELICCDNCPSTFHQSCLFIEELRDGRWYCPNCTCQICGDLVNDKEALSSFNAYKCSQCEHKYHGACQKGKYMSEGMVSNTWFCGGSCQEIYSGLHSCVGISNHIADGFCWTLLRCIHEDQKVHSAQRFALKAECNSKLAVALTIMEECFLSMVDPRTGIDMVPQVLYNWGSEFARLNFHGFYTMVLEKDDVLISVASIRVHGVKVAEMPLIATCSDYRRQGMCRRLMTAIEELLISLKVEKLVISAIPDLVETWTEGFGFSPISNDEKRSLSKINLMVFPGAILLKKPLYETKVADVQSGECSCPNNFSNAGLGDSVPLTEVGACAVGEHATESVQQSDRNYAEFGVKTVVKLVGSQNLKESEVSGEMETIDGVEGAGRASPMALNKSAKVGVCSDGEPIVVSLRPLDGNICLGKGAPLIAGESQGSNLQEQFSEPSCGESVSAVGRNHAKVGCNAQSVNYVASLDSQPQQVCELNEK